MKHKIRSSLIVLMASFSFFTACKQEDLSRSQVRFQLRDRLMQAAASLEKENARMGKYPTIRRLTNRLMPASKAKSYKHNPPLQPLDSSDSLFAMTVQTIFDGPLGDALFSHDSMTKHSETDFDIALTASLCDKLLSEDFLGTDDDAKNACYQTANELKPRLFIHEEINGDYSLTLQTHENNSLLSLRVGANMLQTQFDIKTLFQELERFKEMMPIALPQVQGALRLRMHFKTADKPAACPENEDFCVMSFVDEDIVISTENAFMDLPATLTLPKTDTEKPGIYFSTSDKKGFVAHVNSKSIKANALGMDISIPGLSFKASLPEENTDVLNIQNLSFGEDSIKASQDKMLLSLSLNPTQGHILNTLVLALNEASESLDVTTSPLALLLELSDSSNSDCSLQEKVTLGVSNGSNVHSKLRLSPEILSDGLTPSLDSSAHYPLALNGDVASHATCSIYRQSFLVRFAEMLKTPVAYTASTEQKYAFTQVKGQSTLSYDVELGGAQESHQLTLGPDMCILL